MDLFRFSITPALTEPQRAVLKALAGAFVPWSGRQVNVGINAAWMVQRILPQLGCKVLHVAPPDWPPPRTEIPHVPGMRVRVSGFEEEWPHYLLPWQKHLLLHYAHRPAVHAWWAPGSGKTLAGIVWSFDAPGRVLFITRSGARRTIAADVKRFTTERYFVLEGAKRQDIPDDRRVVITGWDTLVHHADNLVVWQPTTVVFDEIHRAKNFKRRVAIPRLDQLGNHVLRGDGNLAMDFELRQNTSAAAEKVSRAAKRRIGLTGSPVKDRLRDLWAQLDLVEPGEWGNAYDWFKRYCNAHEGTFGGMETTGRSAGPFVQELQMRLSMTVNAVPYSVTHRDLPAKRRQVTYIPRTELLKDAGPEARKNYAKAAGEMAMAHARLAMAAALKRNAVVAEVVDSLDVNDNKGKIVVVTGLRGEAEKLHASIRKKLPDAVASWYGTGDHTVNARDEIQAQYMEHPGPCVLVGTMQAWGECVAPDTLVLGENQRIDNYARKDRVVGASGLVACRGRKFKQFDGQMVEVRATGTLTLAATPNHVVCLAEGRKVRVGHSWKVVVDLPTWRPLKQARAWHPSPKAPGKAAGHFMCIPRVPGHVSGVRFDLDKFTKGDNARKGRATRGNPRWVPLNQAVAWLFGLYAAEGSASPRSGDGQGWRAFLSLNKTEKVLASKAQQILTDHGFPSTVQPTDTNGINVIIRCGPLARLLRALMGDDCHTKRIPDEVLFHKDLNVLRAFIDGYAAGDGHTRWPRVQTATVSKTLALQLQLALARFGRLGCITPWTAKPSKIRGRVVRGGPYFIVTWRWVNQRHQRYQVFDDYLAVPITKRRLHRYKGRVEDIGTTDGTFLVSNLVVHNSLNLQDTDVAFAAMLPFTPGEIAQFEGRFSRQGQRRPTLIRYMIGEGTYDEHVAQMLIDKLPSVERIVGDDELGGFGKVIGGTADEEALVNAMLGKLLSSEYEVDEDNR